MYMYALSKFDTTSIAAHNAHQQEPCAAASSQVQVVVLQAWRSPYTPTLATSRFRCLRVRIRSCHRVLCQGWPALPRRTLLRWLVLRRPMVVALIAVMCMRLLGELPDGHVLIVHVAFRAIVHALRHLARMDGR